MYFLLKNLEEINKILLYQCVNVYGCHCEKCPYYNKALKKCESVEIFSTSLENIKNFLEKNKENIEKTLDKSNQMWYNKENEKEVDLWQISLKKLRKLFPQ